LKNDFARSDAVNFFTMPINCTLTRDLRVNPEVHVNSTFNSTVFLKKFSASPALQNVFQRFL